MNLWEVRISNKRVQGFYFTFLFQKALFAIFGQMYVPKPKNKVIDFKTVTPIHKEQHNYFNPFQPKSFIPSIFEI